MHIKETEMPHYEIFYELKKLCLLDSNDAPVRGLSQGSVHH